MAVDENLAEIENGSNAPGTERIRPTRWALFAASFTTFSLLYFVQSLLPIYSDYFGISAAQASLALSSTTGIMAVALLFSGVLSDRIGRKPIMLASLFASTVLTFLMVFSPNWATLVAIRFAMGISLCGVQAVAMAYLAEEIEPVSLGATMGLFISGGALGGLFGRLFVSALADATGWREATLAMAVIALVASVFFARSLPPSRNFQPQQLRIGQLASSAKKILRDPVLLKLIATGFLLMGAFVTTFNYMTYRLVEAPFNLSHSMVGLVFLVYLTGMSGSASIGNLASRRNRGSVLFCVLVLLLAGIVLTLSDNLLVVIIGLALLTFAFFSGHSIASSWTSSRATQSRALAASLYLFAYYQGSSLLGTGGGYLWQSWGWSGVVVLTSGLTIVAGLISIGLTRNYTRKD